MTQPRAQRSEIDPSPLPWNPRRHLRGTDRFQDFATKFLIVPKGIGAGTPFYLHDFQRDLVESVWDADPRPALAAWTLPRGHGKTTLVAGLGLYELAANRIEGTSIVVVAVTELQAQILFSTARRMVELNEHLADRIVIYRDRLVVPSIGATMQVLPASESALQGLAPRLAIVDEIGYVDPEVWQAVTLATGKWENGTTLGIGTPGPRPDSVLDTLREAADAADPNLVYREISAAGFEHHPVDCDHCLTLANPAVAAGFLKLDAVKTLARTSSEAAFRRARLCQRVSSVENPFLPPGVWDQLSTGQPIPDGAEVVLGLDGSFGGSGSDFTALVACTVDKRPHADLVGIWQAADSPDARIDVLAVEQAVRDACSRWRVKTLVADPFRWQRSLQVLESEAKDLGGLKIVEFPWSPSRVTKATTDLYGAVMNAGLTHSGDPTLAAHLAASSVTETAAGGLRIGKASRSRKAAKIDAAAGLVMAYFSAHFLATRPAKRKRVMTF